MVAVLFLFSFFLFFLSLFRTSSKSPILRFFVCFVLCVCVRACVRAFVCASACVWSVSYYYYLLLLVLYRVLLSLLFPELGSLRRFTATHAFVL